jgi:hypothetical protein
MKAGVGPTLTSDMLVATSATAGGGRPTEPATRPPRRAK